MPIETQALLLVDFNNTDKVHDWRNHVGGNVQEIWDTFTDTQKIAIALDAEIEAMREEWD